MCQEGEKIDVMEKFDSLSDEVVSLREDVRELRILNYELRLQNEQNCGLNTYNSQLIAEKSEILISLRRISRQLDALTEGKPKIRHDHPRLAAVAERLSWAAGKTVPYSDDLRAAFLALVVIGESNRDLMHRIFFFPSESSLGQWRVHLCKRYHIDDDILNARKRA
jgi:hypothetical protein